jgi:hypothetical protein
MSIHQGTPGPTWGASTRDERAWKEARSHLRTRQTSKPKPATPTKTAKPRYIMIGGFLGTGKTTAVGKLAQRLTEQGLRVGLITNDQGRNLVGAAMLRSQGFATEEIPGGCFCCRFSSLVDAARRLTETMRPEVFNAEPVGSCTDLAATVTYPTLQATLDHLEHFRPGKPTPTHRLEKLPG